MDYMSQGQSEMYMGQANLEFVVSDAPRAIYSAEAVNMGISEVSYTPISSFNSGIEMSYSQSFFSTFPASSMEIGLNSNYLSNIMASYGADPNAVREKQSSLDLMSLTRHSPISHVESNFHPTEFIKAKAGGVFVAGAEEIQHQIKEVFEKLMGEEFPSDIKISVLSIPKFRKICPQAGVVGLSYNRRQLGLISEIFVLEGSLASVMLTIGHEIGHVLTSTIEDPALEEAKAYAFSFAWMEVIRKYDIAGLSNAFVSSLPAANGIHDKGYNLVRKILNLGEISFNIYRKLVLGEVDPLVAN